ncbi:hypothetical protein FQN49_002701 [Arthroderma sp. PD_2]|nr:hypothetical protein FQN49_002701 [Arthroderma sp. PD_2]
MNLSTFPFLTANEFSQSCQGFVDRVHAYEGQLGSPGWADVRFDNASEPVLVVRKFIYLHATDSDTKSPAEEGDLETENEEDAEIDDPEALVRQPASIQKYEVEYNITLSPTYQVPVLYFFLRDGPSCRPNELDRVYDLLIPAQFRSELREVGVMGGISITNHPITGIPVYFVHPCATSEALKSVAGSKEQTIETYLLLWLGLVGNCVGLNVPSELVAHAGKS